MNNNCPECKGTGVVALLTSTAPCKACGGTGQASSGQSPEQATDSRITVTAEGYDCLAFGNRDYAVSLSRAASMPTSIKNLRYNVTKKRIEVDYGDGAWHTGLPQIGDP